ncbi:MAG: hypothetical protein U0793_14735 [Gemmataceae bacterium]
MKKALFFLILCQLGCSRRDEIRFVIPKNRPDGEPLRWVGHTLVIAVPPSGQLKIRENPFRDWHRETVFLDSGEAMPIGDMEATPASTVAFWSLPCGSNDTHWFLVGNRSDFLAAKARCATSHDPRPPK